MLLFIQEVRSFENIDQLEEFMLKHGETIVDMMGGEIDRIEMKLRVKKHSHLLSSYVLTNYLMIFIAEEPP